MTRGPIETGSTRRALFARAFERHRAGDLEAADRFYRQLLAVDPDHVDGLHLLGLVRAQSGRLDEAAGLIRKSLALRPGFALAHFNLGNVLRRMDDGEAAVTAYRRAIYLDPDSPRALVNLGVTLRELGRPEEAIDAYRQAIALSPGDAEAHYDLGIALQALGRNEGAVVAYRRAIDLKPDYRDAFANLAAALRSLGQAAAAIDICRRRVDLEPAAAEAWVQLGASLREGGRTAEAVAAYERAVTLDTAIVDAWVGLGITRQEAGHVSGAAEAISHALVIDPRSADAWSVRAGFKRFAPGDPDIGAVRDLLAAADSRGAPPDERAGLGFALSKMLMDAGDADAAFTHLEAANRLKRETLSYEVRDDQIQFREIARSLAPERLAAMAGIGDPSDRPVFIVGMPRSGTTLVEQILASHPLVHGAGELTALEDVLIGQLGIPLPPIARARRLAALTPADLSGIGSAYAGRVAALSPGSARVTDKMPANFRLAGLVRLALPNARIVHCRRDPIDTCLSCYASNFSRGQPFAYDLHELGLYYRAYDELMTHWRECLPPDRFLEIHYEHVIEDLESQARRLLAFCGLDWDDACLAFHQTQRPVRTASVNQVRQPIYQASVGRWRPYERHLGPLFDALARPR